MEVREYIEKLKNDPDFMKNVTNWQVVPAREAQYADFPASLDPRIVEVLAARAEEVARVLSRFHLEGG